LRADHAQIRAHNITGIVPINMKPSNVTLKVMTGSGLKIN